MTAPLQQLPSMQVPGRRHVFPVVVCVASAVFVACGDASRTAKGDASDQIGTMAARAEVGAAADASESKAVTTTVGLYGFDLPELQQLQREALLGDAGAANDIAEYYRIRRQRVEEDIWTRIGAENGSIVGSDLLAKEFHRRGGPDNCLRAIFWLTRAEAAMLKLDPESSKTSPSDLRKRIAAIRADEEHCYWSEQ